MQLTQRDFCAENAQEVKELYHTAFPRKERTAWRKLVRAQKKGECEIRSYFDGETFVGFTASLREANFLYLFFFAVKGGERGKGYGSKILSLFTASCGEVPIVLDIEAIEANAPNLSEREKRKAFYEKNGFRDAEFRYTACGVTYDALYYKSFPKEAYEAFVKERVKKFRA